ncbi:MAG: DUF2380 domain-containing protein [Methylococcales bacterium]
MLKQCKTFLLLSLFFSSSVFASQRIAVLDFELNDLTELPNIPAELVRTASFKPLLEKDLQQIGDYEIVSISPEAQKNANAGVEYLLQHDDSSADLGQKFGADWIIVTKHRKPSFLYSHLIVNVIDVKKRQRIGNLMVELKGSAEKVSQKSVHSLAEKIHTLITHFNQ